MLAQLGAVLYLQEFVPHEGCDLRLLVMGERILAMRRSNPLDWRTNISRGASAAAFTPEDSLVELARRASFAVGAPFAGIDLLPGRDGRLYTREDVLFSNSPFFWIGGLAYSLLGTLVAGARLVGSNSPRAADVLDVIEFCAERGVNPGYPLASNGLLVAITEQRSKADIDRLAEVLKEALS